MTYKVIIPAAGKGKRMGAGKNKLLLELNEVPILIHTLRVFEKDDLCDGIILSISPQEEGLFKELLKTYQINKVEHFVHGGKERQHSVFNGLKVLAGYNGIVLVHDGARPFIDTMLIHELVAVTNESGAAVLAVPVKDTIKKVANDEVVETVERASLWAIQTPQAFRVSLLLEANIKAEENRFVGTDDASLVERLNYPIKIVEGNYDNIKLTTPEDLYFAEAIIRKLEKK